MDCIKNLIGIISTTAVPLPPTDYNVSDSGLFLLEGSENCITKKGCEDLWILEMSDKAIKSAVRQTVEAFFQCAEGDYTRKVKDTKGWIGIKKRNLNVTTKGDYQGIRVVPENIHNTKMTVRQLGIWVDTAGVYEVKVFKNGVEIRNEPITVVTAGVEQIVTLTIPLELPLYNDFEEVVYTFSYALNGAKSLANELSFCSCNSTSSENNKNIKKMIAFDGVYGASVNELSIGKNKTQIGQGLMINAEFECDSSAVLCSEIQNKSFKMVLANAIYHKAIANLIQIMADSKKIDVFTLLSTEASYGKRNHNVKEWRDRIQQYVCVNIDLDKSGCYTCNENRMYIG